MEFQAAHAYGPLKQLFGKLSDLGFKVRGFVKIVLISSSTLPSRVRENRKSNPKSRTFTLLFQSLEIVQLAVLTIK